MGKHKKPASFWVRNKKEILFYIRYVLIFLLASYLFYRRFPNNYQQPNFYAEDGSLLARNIIKLGFLHSITSTFNGYYIWGLYLLAKAGFVINRLFFHDEFANLARSFALVSYLFLGFVTTLPLLLFRKYFSRIAIALIILLTIFVPLTGSDYAIVGTIGNLKFAYIYLAFLLLVYRNLMPENSKKVYLVDVGLLICAYTNVTVYPMLLFALLRYIPKLKGRDLYKQLLRDRTFQSLLVLGVALLPQLYIVKRDGVPQLKGYLDTPFNYKRTIEIFVSRSYLYAVSFPVNKFLNDGLVLLLTGILCVVGVVTARKYRKIFLFGIATVFSATFLFVVKRTGISDSYLGYKSGGPDQFFYPQNWVFIFIISLVVVQLLSKLPRIRYRTAGYLLIFALAIFTLAPNAGTYGKNNFMAENVGTIYAIGKKDCSSNDQQFKLPLYPSPNLIFYDSVSRAQLCTASVNNYYPHTVSFGLAPYMNNYIASLGTETHFTQTFVSTQGNLSGITVYFSTFLRTPKSPYTLTVLDSTCKNKLLTTAISTNKIHDNAYYTIPFTPIADSKDNAYCFSIDTARQDRVDPLAIQLSKPDIYPGGVTTVNDKVLAEDVVFSLYYK